MDESSPLLEMDDIVKTFPGGIVANDGISFTVNRGEIHGLLGENGAGKTTLMKILYGLYEQDDGDIRLRGERVEIDSPQDAIDHGIGMVHQHFMLIPRLSVVQNLIIGTREPHKRFRPPEREPETFTEAVAARLAPVFRRATIDLTRPRERIEELSREYDFGIDPDATVGELAIGQQQRVEILKALYRDVDLLVLDEPTAVLTALESQNLFRTLETLVDDGLTVVLITHKLEEILEATDRTTVLRDGRAVNTVSTDAVTETDLARMMVGRDVVLDVQKPESAVRNDRAVVTATGLRAADDRGQLALEGVDLEIGEGEILGIAGISGNGQRVLGECLTGNRPVSAGSIRVNGVDLTNAHPRTFIDHGVGFIPEDRLQHGVAQDLSVVHNAILKTYWSDEIADGRVLDTIDYAAAREYARELVDTYDIRVSNVDVPVRALSGGNVQKLILAREIERDPEIIIANQPTRGVDIGAIEYIRQALIDQSRRGTGILLISESLEEVLSLSDRILVIADGRFVHETTPDEADRERIGVYMTGQEKARPEAGVRDSEPGEIEESS